MTYNTQSNSYFNAKRDFIKAIEERKTFLKKESEADIEYLRGVINKLEESDGMNFAFVVDESIIKLDRTTIPGIQQALEAQIDMIISNLEKKTIEYNVKMDMIQDLD